MTFSWHPLSLFILLVLFSGLVTALVNYFTVRRLDQYPSSEDFPFVSVLVPTRNEALNIEHCVTSLLAQDYQNFEVIVLNDNSTDDTGCILAKFSQTNDRLKVIKGAPLPEDWLGKHWACHQLDHAAKGELILFTDADTRHAPDMLRASVSALLAENADLVTAFPREEMVTWGERLLVPIMSFGIFAIIPIRLVQKLHLSALSITIGQFMLFRRTAYDAIGGYEAVKMDVVDDVCLGRNTISSGGEWRFLDGTRQISCRMYRGFWEAVAGFSKSLFAVFDYRFIPYFLIWLVAGVTFFGPVMTLVSFWLDLPFTSMPIDYATLSIVLAIALWMIAYRRFEIPAYLVFFYPVSLALFIAVAARSLIHVATGTATWKDRVLDRAVMRWL